MSLWRVFNKRFLGKPVILRLKAAADCDAGAERRHIPTIFNQGIINSWPQDSFTADGMLAASSDELHGVSYNFECQHHSRKYLDDRAHRQKRRDL